MTFETMSLFFSLLAVAANAAVLVLVVIWLLAKVNAPMARFRSDLMDSMSGVELWMAFGVALVATLGSLYLSEIAHLVPCRLCWFQRVAMYPLIVVLGIAAWNRNHGIRLTVNVLAIVGAGISAYHYLIQRFPSLESGSCDVSAPCSAAYIWQWGFVSIPYMAFAAFALIMTLMFVAGANDSQTDFTESPTERIET